MKLTCRFAGAVIVLFMIAVADIPQLSRILVPEAQAFRGRGAAFMVGSASGSAQASAAEAEAAAAKQEAAAAQQQAAAAEQQLALEKQKSAAAQQPAAAPPLPVAAPGTPLPLGTVVPSLPAGCTPTPVGEVTYYYCGGNFYQAVYEGSTLKYITTKPK